MAGELAIIVVEKVRARVKFVALAFIIPNLYVCYIEASLLLYIFAKVCVPVSLATSCFSAVSFHWALCLICLFG
jgi:hypothetical protein